MRTTERIVGSRVGNYFAPSCLVNGAADAVCRMADTVLTIRDGTLHGHEALHRVPHGANTYWDAKQNISGPSGITEEVAEMLWNFTGR